MKSLLRQNSRLVRRSLVASDSLLFDLAGVDYFKDKTRHIKQFASLNDRVTQVLDILDNVPDNEWIAVFDAFLSALHQDDQERHCVDQETYKLYLYCLLAADNVHVTLVERLTVD